MSLANGRYPSSALAAIPGGYLRKDAALRWNAMCMFLRAHGRSIPMPNGSQSSYRNLAGQVAMRIMWCNAGKCGNAAVPGTSNHGLGISVDTNQGATVDSVPQFGFHKRHSDAPWESWHRTWGGYGSTAAPDWKLGQRTISRGCSPAGDIRELKRLLRTCKRKKNNKPYFHHAIPIDGGYGIAARLAVKRFQHDHKMKIDAVVGPRTLRAIRHAAAK